MSSITFKPSLIVCDLDGTMVDSLPDLAVAVDHMLSQLGMPAAGEAETRHWIGNGVPRLIKRAVTREMDGEPDEVLFQQAQTLFQAAYQAGNGRLSRLYPGVREGLDWLRNAGYPLVCVTNKPQRFTEPLLGTMGIRDHFDLVLGGDALPHQKPHPLPLLHAAEQHNIDPANMLMIGDSITDVQTARAAGCAVICVSYGYNHGTPVEVAKPDTIIDSFTQLAGLLPEYIQGGNALA